MGHGKRSHVKLPTFNLVPLNDCLDSLVHYYLHHSGGAAVDRYVLPMDPPNPEVPSGIVAIFVTSDPKYLASFADATDSEFEKPLRGRFKP